MAAQFLTGCALLIDGSWWRGQGVLVRDGVIAAILPEASAVAAQRVALPPEALLSPGLVDVQVNGGGGVLFNDAPSLEAARAIAAAHRRLGTTAILPTLITDTGPAMALAGAAARAACDADCGVIGVHFEGPFLSPHRPGVHRGELIRPIEAADVALLAEVAAGLRGRVMVTLAPECVADSVLRRLAAAGVVLSAGHSEADFERMRAALAAGVTGFTHLYNAMPAPAGRAPGLVTAALLDGPSFCGVIADGVHVHRASLRLVLAAKGFGRVMLVSDSMPPLGTDQGEFMLQGRRILRGAGRLVSETGTLAGADICLADAVRFVVRELDVTVARALEMASAVPAAFLRLEDRVGRIAVGLRADLLLLSPDLQVLGTWHGGAWAGEAGVVAA
jgi:N-acetylglucosamine-6-phosphate deacetylase